jgi:hypothetical protein
MADKDKQWLSNLRALATAATCHEWIVEESKNMGETWPIGSIIDCGSAEGEGQTYSKFIVTTDGVRGSQLNSGSAKDDAQFIAAMNPVATIKLLNMIDMLVKDAITPERLNLLLKG